MARRTYTGSSAAGHGRPLQAVLGNGCARSIATCITRPILSTIIRVERKTQGPSGAIIGAATGMLWAIAAGISYFAIERSRLAFADIDLMYASADSMLLLPGVFYAFWGLVSGAIAGRLTDRAIASDANMSLRRATMIGAAKFSIFSAVAILFAVLFALLWGSNIVSAMSWYTWIIWLTWSLAGAMTGAMLSPSEANRPSG